MLAKSTVNPFPIVSGAAPLEIPQHWWKLDGDAVDYGSSATKYNGSPVNVAYTTGLGGDQAASFNGSTSIININNFASIIDISVPGTIMLWMNTASIVGTDGFLFFHFETSHKFFCDTVADSDYRLQLGMGNVTPFVASGLAFSSWKNIALAWDGSQIETYVGGSLTSIDSYTFNAPANSLFALGNITPISGTRGFNGLMQDVRVYNTQKTITEINAIMSILVP
jgi:hypothetical protein